MKGKIREKLHQAIVAGDQDAACKAVSEALEDGEEPLSLINEVLNPALKEVGNRFDEGVMYLPELILSAEAMEAAVVILKPHLEARQEAMDSSGKVLMATVQGDIHDIGKNIVCALLRANGFEVIDLGRDVPAARPATRHTRASARSSSRRPLRQRLAKPWER